MSGKLKAAEKQIDPLTAAVASVADRHPGFYIGEAGAVSSDKALNKLFNQQLGQAGERSVPLTLLILVLVFGSLLAAWIPLMLGLQAVIATVGLTAIVSHITPMDPNVSAGRDARRPRRRRRLHAVLPAPRARGARGRPRASARRSRRPRQPPDARCWSPARP